jgi:glutamyl-tRNA synthetase
MAGDDPKELLFLCALQNAVKHGGVPQAGAVIGMVMGAHPELRSSGQRKFQRLQRKRSQMLLPFP